MLKQWTDEEFQRALSLLAAGWRAADIARALGRSEAGVRLKLIKAGYSSRSIIDLGNEEESSDVVERVLPPSPVAVVQGVSDEEARRILEFKDAAAMARRQRAEAVERAQRERLVEVFRQVVSECRFDFSAPPPFSQPKHSDAHAAVLLVSDTHIGKVCSPAETEGRAYYNPAHSVARVGLLEREVLRLLGHGPPVDELFVLFLGDVVDGALEHSAEREETLLVSHQFSLSVSVFSQFLLRLGAAVPTVRAYGVSGNHGRWPGQRRPPSVGRESNLDGLVYRAISAILLAAKSPNVTFEVSDAPRQTVEVKSTCIAMAHGDEVRGGEFHSSGIKRDVYNNVLRGARDGRIPDLFCIGDKHVAQTLSIGGTQHIVNGSLVAEDAYGMRFAPAIASQTLFWVCSERGKVLSSEIRLDHAVPSEPFPYELPPPVQSLVRSYL